MIGYHLTLLGITELREDLKIYLEGLRWVEGLCGGLILLAALSSLDANHTAKLFLWRFRFGATHCTL